MEEKATWRFILPHGCFFHMGGILSCRNATFSTYSSRNVKEIMANMQN